MYGKGFITPNMHLQCHLKECVTDYDPLHGFWLFSFERFNGILGQLQNNKRSVEVQLMDRFVRDTLMTSIQLPEEFNEEFYHFFSSGPQSVGTVSDSMSILTPPPILLTHERITNRLIDWTTGSSEVYIALPSHCAKAIFKSS